MAGVWFGVSNESYICIAIVFAELLVILCLSLYLFNPTKDGSGIPEIAGCDVADPEFKRGRISESKSLLNSDSSSLANFLPVPQTTKPKAEATYIRQNSLTPLPAPLKAQNTAVNDPVPISTEEPKTEIAAEIINGRKKSDDFFDSEKTENDFNRSVIKEETTREEVTHREVTPISPTLEKIKTEREIITTTKVRFEFSNYLKYQILDRENFFKSDRSRS